MVIPADSRGIAAEFERVSFSYEGVPVLEDASFHIHVGEFASLIGPNGSGKTTILRLLLGLLKPGGGAVRVFGTAPGVERDAVGYVPQAMAFDPAFPVAVAEVALMGRLRGSAGTYKAEDRAAVERALEAAGVADLRDRPYPALSGGQRRRVLIARALAAEPRLLVLDEPTAGVDAASEERLYSTLAALKGRTTVLIVTHDSAFVSELVDAVLCAGERSPEGHARGIVRHRAVASDSRPLGAFYGEAPRRVVHEVALPEDGCCSEGRRRA